MDESVDRKARIPLLLSPSIKTGLDINWSDPEQMDAAIEKLAAQLTSLNDWLDKRQLAMEESLKLYIYISRRSRRCARLEQ